MQKINPKWTPKQLKRLPITSRGRSKALQGDHRKLWQKTTTLGHRKTWLARWTRSAFRLGFGRTADRYGISRIPTNKLWNTESDSMPSERQELDSTRWAWPPVDWGNTNTSIRLSTTSCHQVVFACAFGAVSTTRGEACSALWNLGQLSFWLQHIASGLCTFKTIFQLHCSKWTWAEHAGLQITCNTSTWEECYYTWYAYHCVCSGL